MDTQSHQINEARNERTLGSGDRQQGGRALRSLFLAGTTDTLLKVKCRHHPIMNSPSKARYQQLIRMMGAFVAGDDRSRAFVDKMEGAFVACGLEGDEQFKDLQLSLAMFGARERESDEKVLADECQYALRVLS